MVSTSGSRLIGADAVDAVVSELFPLAALVTPNKAEAEVLTGCTDVAGQARRLHGMGAAAVLLKGGDDGRTDVKTDWLSIGRARADTDRGTGCRYPQYPRHGVHAVERDSFLYGHGV